MDSGTGAGRREFLHLMFLEGLSFLLQRVARARRSFAPHDRVRDSGPPPAVHRGRSASHLRLRAGQAFAGQPRRLSP